MPKSLPSVKFAIVDAPEVEQFDVRFVYNFFVPDEAVNNSGILTQKSLKEKTSVDFNQFLVDSANFNRFVPRYNHLTWTPQGINSRQRLPNVSIANNLDKIYNETSFEVEQFSSIQFQDSDIREKSKFFLKQLAEELDNRDESENFSPMDLAKVINDNTPNVVLPDTIIQGLDDGESSGHLFVSDKTGKLEQDSTNVFREVSQVGFRSQINNKVLEKVLRSSATSTLSTVGKNLDSTLETAQQIQENSISQNPGNILNSRDYDFEIRDFVSVEAIDTNGFEPLSRVVGYIINKTELTEDGGTIVHSPIIVESPFASSTVDLKIKYGSRYEYTIQTIVLFKVQAEDITEGQMLAVSFLVSSKPSHKQTIKTEEKVPPPPPADFKVEWDYDKAMPRLSWAFPVNSQRDIKYFQVFKRTSTAKPFELVKMYDFDDSIQPTELTETPEIRLVEKLSSPKNYYHDSRYVFTKMGQSPSVIYAVCSVDAHGLSSGYSMQFEIKFDRFKNQLIKKVISTSGAPKAYPNMFVQSEAFVDSIRDSNHKKLKVVFNPDFLKLTDGQGNDLKLIKSGEGTKYRLQMINVDLQEQKVFDIEIKDLT